MAGLLSPKSRLDQPA